MRKTITRITIMMSLTVLAVLAVTAGDVLAGRFHFEYESEPADIRVWLERSYGDGYQETYDGYNGDVYESVVYVVDTDGYIHIVHPLSPGENGYLRGGRVYRIYLYDLGFDASFGAGIAYAYAVSSPVPFDYGHYGSAVFGPRCGYRIYGDPYIGARYFYIDLIGGRCRVGLIAVGHARFYVQKYVRYPRYLCAGWHDYRGVRSYCRGDCAVYRDYALHASDPYRVLHPNRSLRAEVVKHARVERSDRRGWRYDKSREKSISDYHAALRDHRARMASRHRIIVKSSKGSFARGKRDLNALRREFEKNDHQGKRRDKGERVEGKPLKVHKAVRLGGAKVSAGGVKGQKSSSSRKGRVTKVSSKSSSKAKSKNSGK
jgi:hypothetical protein